MSSYQIDKERKKRGCQYYCPECGTVQTGYNHWADGWSVRPHKVMRSDTWRYEHCPGGPIDPQKDKAP